MYYRMGIVCSSVEERRIDKLRKRKADVKKNPDKSENRDKEYQGYISTTYRVLPHLHLISS
jgi:hypothetical protein